METRTLHKPTTVRKRGVTLKNTAALDRTEVHVYTYYFIFIILPNKKTRSVTETTRDTA